MKVRNTQTGGLATVSDEYGARLIATGGWTDAKPKRRKPTKQAAPAPEPQPDPVEVPPTEE
jgi:hypothetical protein